MLPLPLLSPSFPPILVKFMRLRSSTIYIRHTRLRILCRALRSHVLYFPRFWFNAFLPLPPLLFALSTRYPDNAHTHTSLNETEKKKRRKKNRFRIGGWKQFAIYIYIHTNDRREERDTAVSWTIRFAFHQQ